VIAQYLASHAITLVAFLVALVMLVRWQDSKRSTQSVFAWLLGIVFLPFVAIPLYLLLGQRKFPQKAKAPDLSAPPRLLPPEQGEPAVAHLLRQSCVAPARSGNSFTLITTGEAAYERLLALIRDAEQSIDLTIFILSDDATGRGVVEALAERAAHGVRVRLILDAVGSARMLDSARRQLTAPNGEVRAFMPLRHSPVRGRTNLRNHRKLGIVDGQHVFGGGMNLATEYMGPPDAALPKNARWRDLAVIVSGPLASDATALFESDWRYCGGRDAPAATSSTPTRAANGDQLIQLVPSGPDMPTDTVYDALLSVIFAAGERIALVTPYYVPDEALQHALVLAAQRGVRTEVVVPTYSNHRIADVARRALLRELEAAGVIVHYYPHGMVHAKAMFVDGTWAYVGSPNFDMRSLFLNYEVALFLYSPAAVGAVRAWVDALIAESERTGPGKRANWILERAARLVAPEL
jgi:cardiolipin synthase